jgi:competence protein ComEC
MRARKGFIGGLLAAVLAVAAGIAIYYAVVSGGFDFGFNAAERRGDGKLRYYAVDVGQGDCSLFTLPGGESILIDAGTDEESSHLPALLRKAGVQRIDLLVATHAHADHIGGMQRILKEFPVGKVWDSGFVHGSATQRRFYRAVKERKIPFATPKRGYKDSFGDVSIEVIAPASEIKGTGSDTNNNSLVLLISYGDISFLITGDMEREEKRSVEPLPRCTVLKAAHHGSSDGTDAQVLMETRPSAVVLSYARGNPYGHPHREVVRLLNRSKDILRFDTADGTIIFSTDGKSLFYPQDRAVKRK